MPVRFARKILPHGVYSIVVDDGHTVLHCFAECAPARIVDEAMGESVDYYAELAWVRKALDAVSE